MQLTLEGGFPSEFQGLVEKPVNHYLASARVTANELLLVQVSAFKEPGSQERAHMEDTLPNCARVRLDLSVNHVQPAAHPIPDLVGGLWGPMLDTA